MRLLGTRSASAKALGVSPRGLRNSSFRISPGCASGTCRAIAVTSIVVISDFDLERVGRSPPETHPPFIVYPDAVLALTVALQRFQTVARHATDIGQRRRRVQHL